MHAWMPVAIDSGLMIRVARSEQGICRASFAATDEQLQAGFNGAVRDDRDELLIEAAQQLRSYFAGELREFKLPLDLGGTPFQRRVWDTLLSIPYGEVRTYAGIAAAIGAPKAVRAVGSANGRNPVAIIVPCHRVIQSGGGLGGYAGGLHYKRMLLALEGRADIGSRRRNPSGAPRAAAAASGSPGTQSGRLW